MGAAAGADDSYLTVVGRLLHVKRAETSPATGPTAAGSIILP
jgi:hypothetical protein